MEGGDQLKRKDLLYPKLSYEICGALFEVFRQIGGGHQENYFQKATAQALRKRHLIFTEQYYVPINFDEVNVGKYFLDFLIEGKIILELKRGKFVPAQVIDQVKQYLNTLNLELALVACFTYNGVFIKRIVNIRK